MGIVWREVPGEKDRIKTGLGFQLNTRPNKGKRDPENASITREILRRWGKKRGFE